MLLHYERLIPEDTDLHSSQLAHPHQSLNRRSQLRRKQIGQFSMSRA